MTGKHLHQKASKRSVTWQMYFEGQQDAKAELRGQYYTLSLKVKLNP